MLFSCIKALKLTSFLLSGLTEKYSVRAFITIFSPKKHQVQGASPPDPFQGALAPGPTLLLCPPYIIDPCDAPVLIAWSVQKTGQQIIITVHFYSAFPKMIKA